MIKSYIHSSCVKRMALVKSGHFHLISPCQSVAGNKWVVSALSEEKIKQREKTMHDLKMSRDLSDIFKGVM